MLFIYLIIPQVYSFQLGCQGIPIKLSPSKVFAWGLLVLYLMKQRKNISAITNNLFIYSMQQSLSVQISVQQPKSVTIKQGGKYFLTNGDEGIVERIRTNGESVVVYYKTLRRTSIWGNTYNRLSDTLDTFKSKLMDLGAIEQLTIHPMMPSGK